MTVAHRQSEHVLSFCHQNDFVCQANRLSRAAHMNYAAFHEPEEAAKVFADWLKSEAASSKWPTNRHDGPPKLFIRLGADGIFPNWTACGTNYCIAGTDEFVYVFYVASGISGIDPPIPVAADPRSNLRNAGVPESEIDELLRP